MFDREEKRDRFQTIRSFFDNGEFFRSYDLAIEAIEQWPEEMRFAHSAVLSLANAGAIDLALERFAALGLNRSPDLDARALLARLKKDQGFASSGEQRLTLHGEARLIYEEAYAMAVADGDPEAYYPGINAAALALWTGDPVSARQLAREVLERLTTNLVETDLANRYWQRATALEGHLILGELDQATSMATEVLTAGAGQYAQIATTGRQLRRIAASMGISPEFLLAFTPPTIIHFTGHIIAAPGRPGRFDAAQEVDVQKKIEKVLAVENVGTGYGSQGQTFFLLKRSWPKELRFM